MPQMEISTKMLNEMTDDELRSLLGFLQNAAEHREGTPPEPPKRPIDAATLRKREIARQSTEIASTAKTGRLRKMRQHKDATPLKLAEYQFIGEQRARGNSEQTIKGYGRVFKKFYMFVAYFYGVEDGKRIWDLDKTDEELEELGSLFTLSILEADDLIDDFRSYIEEFDQSSEITANYYIRHLKAIINYFADQDIIDGRKIVIKEVKPTVKDVYTDDELRKLLRRPKDEEDFIECRNWTIINMFLGTGCRVSTLTALRVGDIDFDNNLIVMNKQKNGTPNIVQLQQANLAPALREYIYAWRSGEDGQPLLNAQLFCRMDGNETTVDAIKKAIAAYNISRGVEKTSCHLFRHTFAKKWILAGKSIIELKKVLNHSSMKMVEHYSNLWSRDTQNSIDEASALSQVKKPVGKKLQPQKPTNKLQRRR